MANKTNKTCRFIFKYPYFSKTIIQATFLTALTVISLNLTDGCINNRSFFTRALNVFHFELVLELFTKFPHIFRDDLFYTSLELYNGPS